MAFPARTCPYKSLSSGRLARYEDWSFGETHAAAAAVRVSVRGVADALDPGAGLIRAVRLDWLSAMNGHGGFSEHVRPKSNSRR